MKWLLSKQTYFRASIYFLITAVIHFRFAFTLNWLFYLGGALIGLHLLEFVEYIVKFSPSPFRTIFAQGVVAVVTFFVLTSSRNNLGAGLVLFLNLYFYTAARSEFLTKRTLESWFLMLQNTNEASYKNYINLVLVVFCIETLIFILT